MLMMTTSIPAIGSFKDSLKPQVLMNNTNECCILGDWTQQAKLLASDGVEGDYFGVFVSLSDDTALIGASYDDAICGSAYVFTRMNTTWTQQTKLFASDGIRGDYFGYPVALDGNTALIGAPGDDVGKGSAYVFTRNGTTWTQQAKLFAQDGETMDNFGIVSLSGDTALIGAPWDNDKGTKSGSAYVFTCNDNKWTQQSKLVASDGAAGDELGQRVTLDGDTAIIGAPFDDDNGDSSGSAYVFIRTGSIWTQQAKLCALDSDSGDKFGFSVSLSGNIALIGAQNDDDNGCNSGSAYVFNRIGTTWTQQAKLLASDGAAGDKFGWSTSIKGDNALVGAYYHELGRGSAYLFIRNGTTWTQQAKLLTSDGAAGDYFGNTVSIDGNTVLIGAGQDDDNGVNSGSAYVFTKEGGTPDLTFDITGGLGVNINIINNRTDKDTVVDWQIHVQGGIRRRINKTVNGITDVPARGSKIVGTGIFLGLGPIIVIAQVSDEEQTAEGTQIFILSMLKK